MAGGLAEEGEGLERGGNGRPWGPPGFAGGCPAAPANVPCVWLHFPCFPHPPLNLTPCAQWRKQTPFAGSLAMAADGTRYLAAAARDTGVARARHPPPPCTGYPPNRRDGKPLAVPPHDVSGLRAEGPGEIFSQSRPVTWHHRCGIFDLWFPLRGHKAKLVKSRAIYTPCQVETSPRSYR